ncbi:Retinal-binding protein [Lamellibrachia satsuma]|nr:Retinal-binding protein [Lamellibrachia satsuma]
MRTLQVHRGSGVKPWPRLRHAPLRLTALAKIGLRVQRESTRDEIWHSRLYSSAGCSLTETHIATAGDVLTIAASLSFLVLASSYHSPTMQSQAESITNCLPESPQAGTGHNHCILDLLKRGRASLSHAMCGFKVDRPQMTSDSNKTELGNANTKEGAALREFKKRVNDLLKPEYSDYYLSKWLKARNFDVGRAEQMFRKSMGYREKLKADTLLADYTPPEVLVKYLPGGFAGYDREGAPVRVETYGNLDVKGILYSVKKIDIEKTKMLLGEQVMKKLKAQSTKLDKTIDGMTVIIDMENTGTNLLWGPGMKMIAHMGEVVQDNYPEVVKRSFLINAPTMLPLLWRMVRPLISEEMKNKVCILGGDYKKQLLKHVEPDQLPASIGGTMTDKDGDPRCSAFICPGGKVPEKYYLKDLVTTDHMQKLTVPRGDKVELAYSITQPGSLLRFEFLSADYDIRFGITYKTDSGSDDIMPLARVDSHIVPEDGSVTCSKSGTYVVVFDNSYSWTRSKTLSYNIDVLPPEDSTVVEDLDSVTLGGSWGLIASKSECTRL